MIKPHHIVITLEHPKGAGSFTLLPPNVVCITHRPTNIKVKCGHTRSQHKNREIALEFLNDLLKLNGDLYVSQK